MRTVVILLAAGVTLTAQQGERRPVTVRVSGEAVVSAPAERTRLRLSVVSTAGTPERARAKDAQQTADVIARLREVLGRDADIRTANYSLQQSSLDRYTANHAIEVRMNDPAMAGRAIDAATKAGASAIGGLETEARSGDDSRVEALREAAAQARTNAEAIAAALGLRITRVVSAETLPAPVPAAMPVGNPYAKKKSGAAVTPVGAGTVEIRAQVGVTWEAEPR